MLASSYRPVAVLSTISKIIERAAQSQLLEHFEKSGLLNPSNQRVQASPEHIHNSDGNYGQIIRRSREEGTNIDYDTRPNSSL